MTRWCRSCGLSIQEHVQRLPPSHGLEDYNPINWTELRGLQYLPCPQTRSLGTVSYLPAMDLQPWLSAILSTPQTLRQSPTRTKLEIPAGDLVRFTDLDLIRMALRMTGSFDLAGFVRLDAELEGASFVAGRGALNSDIRERHAAPYAILGQTIRVLVKQLVTISVHSARRMAEETRSKRPRDLDPDMDGDVSWEGNVTDSESGTRIRQILAPSHVLQALNGTSPRVAHLRACLARLGAGIRGLQFPPVVKTEAEPPRSFNQRVPVVMKSEDPDA